MDFKYLQTYLKQHDIMFVFKHLRLQSTIMFMISHIYILHPVHMF